MKYVFMLVLGLYSAMARAQSPPDLGYDIFKGFGGRPETWIYLSKNLPNFSDYAQAVYPIEVLAKAQDTVLRTPIELLRKNGWQPYLYDENIVNLDRLNVDTAKPNAVYIIPASDHNGAFADDNAVKFYRDLKQGYDVVFSKVASTTQMCDVLNATPNIKLLVIGGHGEPLALNFGAPAGSYWPGRADGKYLGAYDMSVKSCFKNLTPDAVIVLHSCSTGTMTTWRMDLAKWIWKISGKKRVIAPSEDAYLFNVKGLTPFEIQIEGSNIDESHLHDITSEIPAAN